MLVTATTFHLDKSLVNKLAPLNMAAMLVTEPTFHPDKSLVNIPTLKNMFCHPHQQHDANRQLARDGDGLAVVQQRPRDK
jgi:hypothetical protein